MNFSPLPFVDSVVARRRGRSAVSRRLSFESLDRRVLLAADVMISDNDVPASYQRTVDGSVVTFSPVAELAEIGSQRISEDLDAGNTVIVNTVNENLAGTGNITVSQTQIEHVSENAAELIFQASNDVRLQDGATGSAVIGNVLQLQLIADVDRSGDGIVAVENGSRIEIGDGDVEVIANDASLVGAYMVGGNFSVRPSDPSSSIGIGNLTGELSVDNTELSRLAGATSLTIGSTDGSGAIRINDPTFAAVTSIFGGSITVTDGIFAEAGLTLTAVDASGDGQDVMIESGTVRTASTGDIVVVAGDAFVLAAEATMRAPLGNVSISLDQVDNSDPGTGASAILAGNIVGGSGVTINGGGDDDVFDFPVPPTLPITINAGPSTDEQSSGDTLIADGSGGPIFVGTSQLVFPTSSSAVTFTDMENVRVTSATSVQIIGANSSTYSVAARTATNEVELSVDSGPRVSIDTTSILSFIISGTDGDDTLALDVTEGIPNASFNFENGSNTLRIVGEADLDLTATGDFAAQDFATIDLNDAAAQQVTLDAEAVSAAASEGRLRTVVGGNDSIRLDPVTDWRMGPTSVNEGRFLQSLINVSGVTDTIEVDSASPWRNLVNPLDVNNNGEVSSNDALLVVNELFRARYSDRSSGDLVDPLTVSAWPDFYFDQTADGKVTSLDALRIINFLARNGGGEPSSAMSWTGELDDEKETEKAIDQLIEFETLVSARPL